MSGIASYAPEIVHAVHAARWEIYAGCHDRRITVSRGPIAALRFKENMEYILLPLTERPCIPGIVKEASDVAGYPTITVPAEHGQKRVRICSFLPEKRSVRIMTGSKQSEWLSYHGFINALRTLTAPCLDSLLHQS